jgi:hypothetical protein
MNKLFRWIKYYYQLSRFKRIAGNDITLFPFGKKYPCLSEWGSNREWGSNSGVSYGHYFHQDLLVARRIFQNEPGKHVDIGSRTDGFVAHVASFREIEVFDIRPIDITIPNVIYKQVDFMSTDFHIRNYCDSVSSLHAIEHFGLGRYGDNLDFNGHLKGLSNITDILVGGGKFYFSVPIGSQRIEFNAHRVFSIKYLVELLETNYRIDAFSYVDDKGDLQSDVALGPSEVKNNFDCNYGCGIFELTKLQSNDGHSHLAAK